MLYDMRCNLCKKELSIGCTMDQWESIIKPGMPHDGCYGILKQIIKGPSMIINRSPFPATGNEVQLPTEQFEDVKFTDKYHATEWLGERGLTSKWIENDM